MAFFLGIIIRNIIVNFSYISKYHPANIDTEHVLLQRNLNLYFCDEENPWNKLSKNSLVK